jgi:hypothetical protein
LFPFNVHGSRHGGLVSKTSIIGNQWGYSFVKGPVKSLVYHYGPCHNQDSVNGVWFVHYNNLDGIAYDVVIELTIIAVVVVVVVVSTFSRGAYYLDRLVIEFQNFHCNPREKSSGWS